MKQLIIFILISLLAGSLHAQESGNKPSVEHENQLKAGFTSQIDFNWYGYYDDYYYYYDDPGYNESGLNYRVFLSYEHIWQFPNQIAIGLEPMIGASFRNNRTQGFAGLNTKFYWANTGWWRMGISLFGGYNYAKRQVTFSVPMDGGNYYQRKDLNMHFHSYSFDIGLIPFQFRLKQVPLTIEAIFSLGGLTFLNGRSETYTDINGSNQRFFDNYAFPYFLKGEFKIGYVIPSGKNR